MVERVGREAEARPQSQKGSLNQKSRSKKITKAREERKIIKT